MSFLAYPNYFEEDNFIKNFTHTLENEVSLLHCAILEQRVYLLEEQLKDPKMNVDIRNKNFESPLLAALKIPNKEIALQLVQKLINAKADVNIQDHQGDSPLHEVTKMYLDDENYEKLFHSILQHPNCNINIKNHLGETPIYLVRSQTVAEKLIECGADINCRDNSDNTPIHRHITNSEICNLLISRGANINTKNGNGFTPLHEAVFKNAENTVTLLLNNGADPNVEGDNRVTPLQISYSFKTAESIKEQLRIRSKPIYLMVAATYDCSLETKILQEWEMFAQSEREMVDFIQSQIEFLKSASNLKKIACGKVVARYFLRTIEKISYQNSLRIIESFGCCFGRTLLNLLIKTHDYRSPSSEEEIFDIASILLNRGDMLDYSDLEVIYLQFGDCSLLHILLETEAKRKTRTLEEIPLFPKALFTVTSNLTHIIQNQTISSIEILDLFNFHNLARYCTFPKELVSNLLNTYENIVRFHKPSLKLNDVKKDIQEMAKMSGIPCLLELSRNAVRPMLCEKYKITKPHQLYLILNELRLPPLIISIIMMEFPLYNNINSPKYFPYTRHLYLL